MPDHDRETIDGARAAYIDSTARLYGDVTLGEGSSIWSNAVVRAEVNHVSIGDYSNIQDFVMIHIGYGHPVVVGRYCSVAHHCTLHGCVIEDNCLIGINATIMDGCVVGANSVVAGHTFLREGTIVPPNSIVMGAPGKVVRTQDSSLKNVINALLYLENGQAYARGDHRAWAGVDMQGIHARAEEIVRSGRLVTDIS